MGTRSWFFALLALKQACEGSIETPEGIERQSPSEVDTDAGTGTDTGADTDAGTGTDTGADTDAGTGTGTGTDAGTGAGTDAGTDAGTGGDPGQCAGGPLADPIPNCSPDTVNGHYESMASSSYTQVACGFFTTPTGLVWGVQNFD